MVVNFVEWICVWNQLPLFMKGMRSCQTLNRGAVRVQDWVSLITKGTKDGDGNTSSAACMCASNNGVNTNTHLTRVWVSELTHPLFIFNWTIPLKKKCDAFKCLLSIIPSNLSPLSLHQLVVFVWQWNAEVNMSLETTREDHNISARLAVRLNGVPSL